jgi:protein ImuB
MAPRMLPRWACVNVPALPLQRLLQRHPAWRDEPVAVVAEDRPQGAIAWVNGRARRTGIVPGMRYATGLSLVPRLRAGVLSPAEITASVEMLSARLHDWTPGVEPSGSEPGLFWLDATGVSRRTGSVEAWARAVHAAIRALGFQTTIVVGFSRVGVAVLAKARRDVVVFADAVAEQAAVRQVPLQDLGLDPAGREDLTKLGIQTIAEFLRLPAGGLHERFGPAFALLHRQLAGRQWESLQPIHPTMPLRERVECDTPETDATHLLFPLKTVIDSLRTAVAARRAAITALHLDCGLDDRTHQTVWIRPAAPTLNGRELLELLRLRLETLSLSAGVTALTVTVEDTPATAEQLRLFPEAERRDLAAANRALARLRATFGDDAVRRVRLREGHLPEARWVWELLDAVVRPQPHSVALRPLMRRIVLRPSVLSPPPRAHRDVGWLPTGPEAGAVVRIVGPDVLSGGWWRRELHRDYYFAETVRGDLLWLFYDRRRRQWFLHGRVE